MNDIKQLEKGSHHTLDDDLTSQEAIKAIAIYEIVKGLAGLCATFALWQWHSYLLNWLNRVEAWWVTTFGDLFDTQVDALIVLAQRATEQWQWFLVIFVGYTLIRFIQAYGLWYNRTWAYWFSIFNYGILIPFEIYYILTNPFDWLKMVFLLLNILVVYIVYRNMRKKSLI